MKNILSLCLLFGIQYAHADSVMIHVTGNILGSTCMVDTDSRNMNVDMGEAMSGQFRKAGSTGEWVDFQLSLSHCPAAITQVTSTFRGTADTDTPTYFANQGSGDGVALELSTRDHSQTLSSGDQTTTAVNAADGTVVVPLSARYVATTGNAKGGSFESVVEVTFTYE
ncbi:fimbrial protein [Cronobacter dublinensis]|uniref:fimbrial protein n=1 Tax=Cronobacter dublinensis TaxID=413497 RepID=UPI0005181CF1|nr:fimbrial protein [Cronobacter dublinensis]MDI6440685.1 fimbrial protein [Cronobacter dublinensis]NCH94583.1 type 1 fimbrial protein [Cronobacter dublinensis]